MVSSKNQEQDKQRHETGRAKDKQEFQNSVAAAPCAQILSAHAGTHGDFAG